MGLLIAELYASLDVTAVLRSVASDVVLGQSGVNFINFLRAAFAHTDPKSAKN